MGYRGKLSEREEARRLRARGWTMPDIAAERAPRLPQLGLVVDA